MSLIDWERIRGEFEYSETLRQLRASRTIQEIRDQADQEARNLLRMLPDQLHEAVTEQVFDPTIAVVEVFVAKKGEVDPVVTAQVMDMLIKLLREEGIAAERRFSPYGDSVSLVVSINDLKKKAATQL